MGVLVTFALVTLLGAVPASKFSTPGKWTLGSSALVLGKLQRPQLPTNTLWAIGGGAGHVLLSRYAHSTPAVVLSFRGWKLARQEKEINNSATIFLALYLWKTASE